MRARGAAEVAELYKYFSLLRSVAHPGVIDIEHQAFGAQSGELTLAKISGRRLSDAEFPDAESVARCMASLAATVAHLHECRVVHGSIDAEKVAVTQDGRAVIVDLRGARPLESGDQAAVDVAAVGGLLLSKLRFEADPIRARINSGSGDAELATQLRRIAAASVDVDPANRPTSRRLAAQLRRLTTPTEATAKAQHRRDRNWQQSVAAKRRLIGWAAGVSAAVLVLAGGVTLWPEPSAAPQAQVLVRATDAPSCPERPTSDVATDIDSDGCADSIVFEGGRVLVNGTAYEVAQPGDVMVVGRWKPEAPRTLAVLRPSTGRVYVFDGWPTGSEELTPRTVANVGAAKALTVVPRADGTDDLRVTTAADRTVEIDAARAALADNTTNTTVRGRR